MNEAVVANDIVTTTVPDSIFGLVSREQTIGEKRGLQWLLNKIREEVASLTNRGEQNKT